MSCGCNSTNMEGEQRLDFCCEEAGQAAGLQRRDQISAGHNLSDGCIQMGDRQIDARTLIVLS
jgi:hypothetical protein